MFCWGLWRFQTPLYPNISRDCYHSRYILFILFNSDTDYDVLACCIIQNFMQIKYRQIIYLFYGKYRSERPVGNNKISFHVYTRYVICTEDMQIQVQEHCVDIIT